MKPSLDLTDIEKRVFRSTFVDGLYDMYIGLFLITFANIPLINDIGLGDFWSSMILLPVLWGGWLLVRFGKRRIVIPRLGTVQFGRQRQKKNRRMILIAFGLTTLMLIVGFVVFLTVQSQFAQRIAPAVMSLIFLAAFFAGGFLLEFQRLFVYGIFVSVSVIIGEILFARGSAIHHGIPLMFNISGGLIFIVGMAHFIRFLNQYPEPEGGSC